MTLDSRASVALNQVRNGLGPKARDTAEHALALALETMFGSGDSRSFLTTTELDRYIGADGSHNATRVLNRLVDSGALVELTGTPEGEAFRETMGGSGRYPSNTRVFTLPVDPSEEGRRSQVKRDDLSSVATTLVPSEGQTIPTVCLPVLSCITSNEYAHAREYVAAMEPRSPAWKGNTLGSREARAYAVVVCAHRPVQAHHVSAQLNIGNKGAKQILSTLKGHRLIVRAPDDSGWIPGPVTPDSHDPATCPACDSPAHHSTPAVPAPERGPQRQDGPSMPDPQRCPVCHRWECQADHGQAAPVQSSTPATVTRRPDGTYQLRNGRCYKPVSPEFVHEVHPVSGMGIGETLKPGYPDYPSDVGAAMKRRN